MADLFLYRVSSHKANKFKDNCVFVRHFSIICKLFTCSDNVFP